MDIMRQMEELGIEELLQDSFLLFMIFFFRLEDYSRNIFVLHSQRLKFAQFNQKALRADSYKNIKQTVEARVPLTDRVGR